MSASEKLNSINLKDIANISETEFKNQITTWIDEHGVSRALQSKLRADLFEQFNKTNLGRQMAIQHQQAHRLVLSPLILVLNTLVSEFLYAENCHFTLSVFATEVPFKNTLPNFEAVPKNQPFRFSDDELKDIFEAMGVSSQVEKSTRRLYQKNSDRAPELLNRSLLYCVLKNMLELYTKSIAIDNKTQTDHIDLETKDLKSTLPYVNSCPNCSSPKIKTKKFEISSRYFKYLNRYLDILSDRVREMSKSLVEMNSKNKASKCSKSTIDTSTIETNLKKNMEKIIENLGQITKSKQKSKKFRDILNSIDRLSNSLEKCSENLESILHIPSVNENDSKSSKNPLEFVDYDEWLQQLRSSNYGRKFLDRFEISLQKTLDRERDNLEKLYEEKLENYRILIKLHYKQKFSKSDNDMKSTPKGPEDFLRKVFTPIESINTGNPNLIMPKEHLIHTIKTSDKERYVDHIVQSAKARLKQLELESEKLDESFQAYLKRQYTEKTQLNADIAKIWESYRINRENFNQQMDPIITKKPSVSLNQMGKNNELDMNNKNNVNYALNILKELNVEELGKKIENPYLNFDPKSLINYKTRPKESKETAFIENKSIQCSLNGHNLLDGAETDVVKLPEIQRKARKKVRIFTSSSESSDDKVVEATRVNGFRGKEKNGGLLIQGKVAQTSVIRTLAESEGDEKSGSIQKVNEQTKSSITASNDFENLKKNGKSSKIESFREISNSKVFSEFTKTSGDENRGNNQIDHQTLIQIAALNPRRENLMLNDVKIAQSTSKQSEKPQDSSAVFNNGLDRILERNTEDQFNKLTEFVLVSSSDLSDENQQISTGLGRNSSPDDFWK